MGGITWYRQGLQWPSGAAGSSLLTTIISYWTLNEASAGASPVTRFDSVVSSANDLTDNNTTASAVGKIGNATNHIRANSEYLSRADNASLSMAGATDFHISSWVNLTSKSANMEIICKGKTDGSVVDYSMRYVTGTDRFVVLTGGLTAVTANSFGSPTLSTWYFVQFWFTMSSNTWSISVNDGTTDSAVATPQNTSTGFPFNIGAFGNTFNFYDGMADEVGVWKRLLTAAERTSLYNGGAGLTYPF